MEEIERGGWANRLDFLLSCIGNSVGLSILWRFPYLCYKHGGASFLLAYVVMLILAGLPVSFCELALGQFSSEGVITVWRVSPIFKGKSSIVTEQRLPEIVLLLVVVEVFAASADPVRSIGYAMVMTSVLVATYYNVIIMYSIYYMVVSLVNMDGTLPWETCDNHFNTDRCRRDPFTPLIDGNETFNMHILYKEKFNETCVWYLLPNITSFYNLTHVTMSTLNSTQLQQYDSFRQCKLTWTSSSEEYWS